MSTTRMRTQWALHRLGFWGLALLAMWLPGHAMTAPAASAEEPGSNPDPPMVRGLAYSPDGDSLAIVGNADRGGLLVVWNMRAIRPRFRRREPVGCRSVAFSPDGKALALARDAPEALLLEARTGEPLRTIAGHRNKVHCVAFTPDGRRLITGSADRTARVWDAATGKEEYALEEHKDEVFGVAASSDGKRLATADGRNGTARLWDPESRRVLHSFDWPHEFTPHVRFSPDGRLLAVSSWRGTLSLFDAASYALRMQFRDNSGVKASDFSPDQRWLAVASFAPLVQVYPFNPAVDGTTKARVTALLARFEDDSYPVREAAHRELAAIAMAAEPQLREAARSPSAEVRWRCRKLLARLSQPESAVKLTGHAGEVTSVAFSPDGRHLASGDDRGEVRIWSVSGWSREVVIPFTGAKARRD